MELKVWQRAKDLAVYCYGLTRIDGFSRDFGLADQFRRAAVSISSNIAEGDEYCNNRQSVRYLLIAKGSSAEVLTQAIIAHEVGYISQDALAHVKEECTAISKMLQSLINKRSPA